MIDDTAWCAEIAKNSQVPHAVIQESLEHLRGDRPLLENVLATAAMARISPLAVIEAILERRG